MKNLYEVLNQQSRPVITVNCVIFGYDGKDIKILLIRRDIHDHKEKWALPGSLASMNESLEDTARRALLEEVNIDKIFLKQFGVFSDVNRVPNERVICITFYALLQKSKYHINVGNDAIEAKWFSFHHLPPMILDHKKIAEEGLTALRNKLHIDPVALEFVESEFTLGDLQKIYEIIFEKKLDRRNFQRKLLSSGLFISKTENTINNLPKNSTIKYSFDRANYDKIKMEIKRNPIDI